MKLTNAQIEELETQNMLIDTRSEWLDMIQDIVGCTHAEAKQIDADLINGGREMTKYRAICGNTSRTIKGCTSPAEALKYAIKCYDDCLDHTDSVDLYDMEGNYLCGEDN